MLYFAVQPTTYDQAIWFLLIFIQTYTCHVALRYGLRQTLPTIDTYNPSCSSGLGQCAFSCEVADRNPAVIMEIAISFYQDTISQYVTLVNIS